MKARRGTYIKTSLNDPNAPVMVSNTREFLKRHLERDALPDVPVTYYTQNPEKRSLCSSRYNDRHGLIFYSKKTAPPDKYQIEEVLEPQTTLTHEARHGIDLYDTGFPVRTFRLEGLLKHPVSFVADYMRYRFPYITLKPSLRIHDYFIYRCLTEGKAVRAELEHAKELGLKRNGERLEVDRESAVEGLLVAELFPRSRLSMMFENLAPAAMATVSISYVITTLARQADVTAGTIMKITGAAIILGIWRECIKSFLNHGDYHKPKPISAAYTYGFRFIDKLAREYPKTYPQLEKDGLIYSVPPDYEELRTCNVEKYVRRVANEI